MTIKIHRPIKTIRPHRPLNLKNEFFTHTESIPDNIPDLPDMYDVPDNTYLPLGILGIVEKYGKEYEVFVERTDTEICINFYSIKSFPIQHHISNDTITTLYKLREFLQKWILVDSVGKDITETWNPTMAVYEGIWIPLN